MYTLPHILLSRPSPYSTDAWQIKNILQVDVYAGNPITSAQYGAVLEYGESFVASLAPVFPPSGESAKNGACIHTCVCHCVGSKPVNGKLCDEWFADWVYGKTKGADSVHIDMDLPNSNGTNTDKSCIPLVIKS
jgi:hypothetical protein